MASPKKQIRTNQVLKVIKLSNDGMSISDACFEARIARSTFYLFCDRNPEVIADFQELQRGYEIEQLMVIFQNRTEMIQRLSEQAKSKKTSGRTLLKILQYMDKCIEDLSSRLLTNTPRASKEEVAELLTGPELRPGVSRFHNSEIPTSSIDIPISSGSYPG